MNKNKSKSITKYCNLMVFLLMHIEMTKAMNIQPNIIIIMSDDMVYSL